MTPLWPVLAQADPLLTYINYGVLGLSVLALLMGKAVPGVLHDRREEADKAEIARLHAELKHEKQERARALEAKDEEIARLNSYIQEKVLPAIIRFTDSTAQIVERRVEGHDSRDHSG